MLKIVKKMLKIGDFQHFFKFFSSYCFQVFFGFLGSARTKQNFILMVKSQFPKWFGLQKGKRNMQKQHLHPEILRFFGCYVFLSGGQTIKKTDFSP